MKRSYANAWVLGKDLPALVAETQDPELKGIYQILKDNYTYPVDSTVISTALEFRGHLPSDGNYHGAIAPYLELLQKGLAE